MKRPLFVFLLFLGKIRSFRGKVLKIISRGKICTRNYKMA